MREARTDDLPYPPSGHEGIATPTMRLESTGMVEGSGSENQFPLHLIEVALRRKWSILVPFFLAASVTLYLCVALPPIYRSETTILVEPQQVPEHYIQSTVTGSVRDRLNTISQQILSRTRLESVIRELGLYRDRPRDLIGAAWHGSKIVPPPLVRLGTRARAMRAPTMEE